MQRRRYTPEFKRVAVRMAREPGAVIRQVAKDLGLPRSVSHKWIPLFVQGRWEAKPRAAAASSIKFTP